MKKALHWNKKSHTKRKNLTLKDNFTQQNKEKVKNNSD